MLDLTDSALADAALADGALVEGPEPRVPSGGYRRWARRWVAVLVGTDLLAALVATLVCWVARPATQNRSVDILGWNAAYWMLAVLVTPVWLGAMAASGAYRRSHASERLRDYRLPIVTSLRLAGAACILAFALHIPLSRLLLVVYFPALVVSSLIFRGIARRVLAAVRRRGMAVRRMLLVGDAACVSRFARYLSRSATHDYTVVGACVPEPLRFLDDGAGQVPVVGRPDELVDAADRLGADTVSIVGGHRFTTTTLQEVSWRIERSGRDLLVAPDMVEVAGPRIRTGDIEGLPLLHIADPLIGVHRQRIKAFYERIVGALLLLVLSPVFAVVAIAVLIDSGRPVFYRQRRVGYRQREFTMVKFRTMVNGAETLQDQLRDRNHHDGALFKIRDDPRVTRVGRLLRRYSIDELPQLINVVKGQMLLIGPRPVLPSEVSTFGEAAQRRFLARPGLTGLWQVSGRSDIPWEEAVRLDLYYIENWSLWLDLMILWRTLGVVVWGSGGY